LYSVAQGGDIREHSWDGDMWVDSVIDAISGATVDITVGRGRNDDTVRVYVTSAGGMIYEFTNSSPNVGLQSNRQRALGIDLAFQPNPFNRKSSISYSLTYGARITLRICNILGVEVSTLVDDFQAAGYHTIHFDGRDRFGMSLPSGVYFCRLQCDGRELLEKIIRID
jgi:hypothetical protein